MPAGLETSYFKMWIKQADIFYEHMDIAFISTFLEMMQHYLHWWVLRIYYYILLGNRNLGTKTGVG